MGKEKNTDMWVHDLLTSANIKHEADGSDIKEINEALKTASKRNTGKVGKPEFICVVKDFLIVIEDKASISKHIKLDENDVISLEVKDVTDYAVNGAYFYGKHLFDNTSYKKIIAFGVSGNSKKHKITPLFIDGTEYCRILPDVESFISFNEMNIDEYYIKEVLKENTNEEKELSEILKDAAILHEDLRNYGNPKDIDKPLIVSGILLALREMEYKNFSVDNLTGDDTKTDGTKIYEAIKTNLDRSNVKPETKKDKLLHQFSIIKDTAILNEKNGILGMTPLKYFTIFLKDKLYDSIRFNNSSEDYLGRFYGEFMSYSGGDGQTLGIVLTPKHITDLFCKLADLKDDDIVLDPCCGTGGFLISAMHEMVQKIKESNIGENSKQNKIKNIKQKQLHGIELQPYMFTIATTNMILRGDGKSNIINENFLSQESGTLQLKQANVGMMNPPYSQGSSQNSNLYELSFAKHLLDSLVEDGKGIIIVPQSCMTGKTEEEASLKEKILEKHTLEGVITLNKDTFYGVGTLPCIAVFTAHQPHPEDKLVKFINFEDDGYKVFPHIGLVETESAIDKKEHLLDVWFDRIDAESKFCVKSTVKPDDEWLHSFYYFNDEIPTKEEFDKTVADYITFMVNMMSHNRGHLFEGEENE